MNRFFIPYIEREDDVDWQSIAPAYISAYLWEGNGYRPPAFGQLAWSSRALLVRLWCGEQNPRCTFRQWNEPVYEDSCLEFFVNLSPSRVTSFFNFEANSGGTMLAGFGTAGPKRVALEETSWREKLSIRSSLSPGAGWEVTYRLPWELLKLYQPDFEPQAGWVATGNFFKCGNETALPHYGCWNPVDLPEVNFHRPEFFAPLIFVK